jgi:hypothetical protein
MARGDEGESVNEIRALLVKLWLLALSSSGEEYHGLGERQSNICGCCASAILRHFPQAREPFYLLYADFADGLRSIQINDAVFKPGLRVGHASIKRRWIHRVPDCHGTSTSAERSPRRSNTGTSHPWTTGVSIFAPARESSTSLVTKP